MTITYNGQAYTVKSEHQLALFLALVCKKQGA